MTSQSGANLDELERAFPGSEIMHLLQVTTEPSLAACRELLAVLEARGCHLHALHVSRTAERLDHRLHVHGIGAAAARSLSDELATRPGVRTISVEHQILRR